MAKLTQLPRLSRVEFFRLQEGELIAALARAITNYVQQSPKGKITADHAAVVAWSQLSRDVPNGGFEQFFFNHGGDVGVMEAARLLDKLEVPKAGPLLHDALAVYRRHKSSFKTANPWDDLFGKIPEFDKLSKAFANNTLRGDRAIETWIRGNIKKLANDEVGNPIDAKFTGAVEIMQPNGLVGEYLEVKNGKPSGAYREFFDDGTVRHATFYRSGKVSAYFWPTGQVKRKLSRQGKLTLIEWYYPGGQLQKRYVQNKDGYAAEPIRRFHENGQLAEEVTAVEGEKLGPWLKFFPDGSPQLQAEYVKDEKLVVHNAWNADRVQVVKDGTGIFRDDGRDIEYAYEVFFEHDWHLDRELKDGVPHGKTTMYEEGVLASVTNYVNGVEDGEATTYWDNGRVREVTKYVNGRAKKSKSFPRLDRPVPAVVLRVEANEKLYTAWEHMRVDEYPRVLNCDEIQQQLTVPDFLREVYERNLAKAIKDDYEDWNTFNDGIAYFITVSETGAVKSVIANGSNVYSGGDWETYRPLLRKLRFEPGRIRGRAVECRVLARVDHTFVEGKEQLT